jgi:hypothetical protein
MNELKFLSAQLTPEEKSGVMLSVTVPRGTLKKLKTRSAQNILAEVKSNTPAPLYSFQS